MNKQTVYQALERQMLGYADLVDVAVSDDGESLVPLVETPALVAHQLRAEMLPITGRQIYVRQTVRERLGQASLQLQAAGLQLQVGYGYRALSVQRANFARQRDRLRGTVPEASLNEAAHRCVAVPEIAGHPTGGAVDVRPLVADQPADCGTAMWEFVPDSYTFSPFIGRQQRDTRLLLRAAMTAAGFAPFDGEWWHFSYGDKEWARYYEQPAAVYQQLEFSTPAEPQV